MINITKKAAEQIRHSAKKTNSEEMPLRIAAKVAVDESIEYGIGFDASKEDDLHISCDDIEIVIAPEYADLLNGATLDFVEIEGGSFNFIVLNPNDPNFKPPQEE